MDDVLDRLNGALESCLWDQLRIIADRLEEGGAQELAQAYRFLADQKLAPLRYDGRWHWREHMETVLPLGHQLPREATWCLLNEMPLVVGMKWNEAGSMAEAYHRAALAIVAAPHAPREPPRLTALDAQRIIEAEDEESIEIDPDWPDEAIETDDIPF